MMCRLTKGATSDRKIIARMESRGKLAKKMMLLKPETAIADNIELTANGKKVGTITSSAQLPDGHVALGYVKTAVLENNTPLMAGETAVEIV